MTPKFHQTCVRHWNPEGCSCDRCVVRRHDAKVAALRASTTVRSKHAGDRHTAANVRANAFRSFNAPSKGPIPTRWRCGCGWTVTEAPCSHCGHTPAWALPINPD